VNDFFDQQRRPGEPGQRMERREESRRRRRRRRLFALAAIVLVAAAAAAVAVRQPWRGEGTAAAGPPPSSSAAPTASSSLASGSSPAASGGSASPVSPGSPSPAPSTGAAAGLDPSPTPGQSQVVAPAIVQDLVPYGAQRKAEMAAYSQRHYGQATWVLHPQAIVLHYTATATYAAAHHIFVANAPVLGEPPGVAAHFVIDEYGTIYQQVPLDVRCRHAIGLDWCALGVEFVQPAGSGPSQAIAQIFARPRQLDAGLRLVAWLQATYDIGAADVVGHAEANTSPLFKDLLGARNDHRDWNAAAVARFRRALTNAE
jgi:hypothetical protein